MAKCPACGNDYKAGDVIGEKCSACKKKEIDALNSRALIASIDAVIANATGRSGEEHTPGKGTTKGDHGLDRS